MVRFPTIPITVALFTGQGALYTGSRVFWNSDNSVSGCPSGCNVKSGVKIVLAGGPGILLGKILNLSP
eukprot:gene10958-biopygen1401